MGRPFMIVWFLIPVGLMAWHFGPGQEQLARDKAAVSLRQAEAAEASRDWASAALLYGQAAADLPEGDHAQRNRLTLLQARSRIRNGEILEGQEQIEKLLAAVKSEVKDDSASGDKATVALTTDAFNELAMAGYYAAWIMRLEGATSEEWKPEAEKARQLFRFLAEQAQQSGDSDAATYERNLENTIDLEQMDLNTLRAKPPPKNCNCNCRNLSQRKRKQCQSRSPGKKPQQAKQQEEDKKLRETIHSAGIGESEGSGS